MVRSLPRLCTWAPVSRSISLRFAFRSPKRARATRLSSRVRRSVTSRSVTGSLNLLQIARARALFNVVARDPRRVPDPPRLAERAKLAPPNAVYARRRARRQAPRSDTTAGQTDRRRGDQAGRPHAAAAGARRLPLGPRADAGDAGPLPGRGDLRGGRRAGRGGRRRSPRGAGRSAAADRLPVGAALRRGEVRHRRRRARHRRQAGAPPPARVWRRRGQGRRRRARPTGPS